MSVAITLGIFFVVAILYAVLCTKYRERWCAREGFEDQGGMGVVLKAWHRRMERTVALKVPSLKGRGLWAALSELSLHPRRLGSRSRLMRNYRPLRFVSIRFEGAKSERLGDQLVERLEGARLKRLQFLEIPLTNAGVERLSSIASLSELADLSMRSARVDDDCLKHFAKFKELDWVSLEAAPITNVCFPQFKNLTLLNLARTRITDDGLRHLKDYPRLAVLNLSQTSISDAGLKHLWGLTRLQEVVVDRTKVTIEGVRELRIALQNCNVGTDLGR